MCGSYEYAEQNPMQFQNEIPLGRFHAEKIMNSVHNIDVVKKIYHVWSEGKKWNGISIRTYFALYSNLSLFHQLDASFIMMWKRTSLLLLFVLNAQSIKEDKRSLEMSVMPDSQFQCVDTTCLPFLVVTVSNILDCQLTCLSQVQCQAASFQQSTSSCKLFTKLQYRNIDMVAAVNTITMMVISETRIPAG